jgi:hypothetical protein
MILALTGCTDTFAKFGIRLGPSLPDQKLVDRDPYERGKEFLATGRLGLAVHAFRTALHETPQSVEALNGLAVAYDQLGRHDQALRHYKRALTLAPDTAQTLNNIGYSYLRQGRMDLAVSFLNKAKQIAGDDRRIEANIRVAQNLQQKVSGGNVLVADAQSTGLDTRHRLVRIVRSSPMVQTLIIRDPVEPAAAREKWGVGELSMLRQQAEELEAAKPTGANAMSPPEPSGLDVSQTRVEISIDAGHDRRAARMVSFLASQGYGVWRVSDAQSGDRSTTTIYYRAGSKDTALKLATIFPVSVEFVAIADQTADIKVRLGEDLVEFDRRLVSIFGKSPHHAVVSAPPDAS